MAKKKIAYYAHPMSLYGTEQEKRDVELIKSLGFSVLNPNTSKHRRACEQRAGGAKMDYFVCLVAKCDVLIFRGTPCGMIPSGVYKEVEAAVREHMPILELPCGLLRRSLTYPETIEYLRDCGER